MPNSLQRSLQRIRELKRAVDEMSVEPMKWSKLKLALREIASVLLTHNMQIEELAATEEVEPACKMNDTKEVLAIRHMLNKSREIRTGLRQFRTLQSNYSIPGMRGANEDTLNGYQHGFDRAIGELAKYYSIDQGIVDELDEDEEGMPKDIDR